MADKCCERHGKASDGKEPEAFDLWIGTAACHGHFAKAVYVGLDHHIGDGNNGANTVIIVTHNSLIAEVADTVIRVKNGTIESVTTNQNPKEIDEVKW